jgi:hypothetical protein
MIEDRSLSSASQAPACLDRCYPSSQKGGTVIVEDIADLGAHEASLEDPDRYRPAGCRRCGSKVHIHDLRPRVLRADPSLATEVLRFRCADRKRCGATWEILPAFLARHLWRSWPTVESAVEDPQRSEVPERTRRRWRARLACSARKLMAVLSTAVHPMWSALLAATGLETRRVDLVHRYRQQAAPARGRCLAELAGVFHRLSPGVRLM